MGTKEDLEADIIKFFEQIKNQSRSDQRKTLRLMMEKYLHLAKSPYMMDKQDLNDIISGAKSLFADKSFPCFIGSERKRVYQDQQSNLCVIEATISHLNNKDCLKNLPQFDYREDKF